LPYQYYFWLDTYLDCERPSQLQLITPKGAILFTCKLKRLLHLETRYRYNLFMNIGIDGRPLEAPNPTGVPRYIYQLSRELDTLLPQARFYVYSKWPLQVKLFSDRWTSRVEPSRWARSLIGISWLKLRAGWLAKDDKLDVFWGGSTFYPVGLSKIAICSVHDFMHEYFPETMETLNLIGFKMCFSRDVTAARVVTANSRGTADKIKQMLGRDAEVIYASTRMSAPSQEIISEVKNRYSLRQPYILAVGTPEPRKNFDLLVRNFTELRPRLPNMELAIVGGGGWKNTAINALLQAPGIRRLGFVPDADMPALYAGAELFVLPSKYEGFGSPALEARACGTRIVATDIPEIREAGGSSALYVTPDNLKEGILAALSKSPNASEPFPSWRDSAMKLANLFV
jgi:glycosyltransferase involved in cell wall biosynthesis